MAPGRLGFSFGTSPDRHVASGDRPATGCSAAFERFCELYRDLLDLEHLFE